MNSTQQKVERIGVLDQEYRRLKMSRDEAITKMDQLQQEIEQLDTNMAEVQAEQESIFCISSNAHPNPHNPGPPEYPTVQCRFLPCILSFICA